MDRIAHADPLGAGIGGRRFRLEVGGHAVFVKAIPLTDLERKARNFRSSANIFDLPPFYQYGVGSTGFGAWRELAAHEMTTAWVLSGRARGFPLLYGWRTVERDSGGTISDDLGGPDEHAAYWAGSVAVRRRIEALEAATAELVLFLEDLPVTAPDLLRRSELPVGTRIEDLLGLIAFMNGADLFHFDTHLDNIQSDGASLYLCDFGLATSGHFDLDPAERRFLAANVSHDAAFTVCRLIDWMIAEATGTTALDHYDAVISAVIAGDAAALSARPHWIDVVTHFGPLTLAVNGFYRRLLLEGRTAPYPKEQIERLWAEVEAGL